MKTIKYTWELNGSNFTAIILQYSIDGTTWINLTIIPSASDIGDYVGTVPNTAIYFRILGVSPYKHCEDILSNVIDTADCIQGCHKIVSVELVSSTSNPTGVTYKDKRSVDGVVFTTTISIGQTIIRNEAVDFGGYKIIGNTVGNVDVCFTQEEVDNALAGSGVITKSIIDYSTDPYTLVGQFNFTIDYCPL